MYIGISPGFFHNITYIQPFFLQYIFDCFIPIPSSLATFFLPFCSKFHCRRKLLSPLPFISFPFFPHLALTSLMPPNALRGQIMGQTGDEERVFILPIHHHQPSRHTFFFFASHSFISSIYPQICLCWHIQCSILSQFLHFCSSLRLIRVRSAPILALFEFIPPNPSVLSLSFSHIPSSSQQIKQSCLQLFFFFTLVLIVTVFAVFAVII